MIPTYFRPYTDGYTTGELRIGWASWDNGSYTDRSIKWAYRDKSGKISRGSPEIPFGIAADMVILGVAKGEFSEAELKVLRAAICRETAFTVNEEPVLINNEIPAKRKREEVLAG